MFLNPDTAIIEIGDINVADLDAVCRALESEFADKWVMRTSKLMNTAKVLKARTVSTVDVLAQEHADKLFELLYPVIQPIIAPDEYVPYLDVSSLPAGTSFQLHVDYMWMQAMSRRIHIPIKTNTRSVFATLDSKNEPVVKHLQVGKIYEVNNFVPHIVSNAGAEDRWHIMFDVLKTEEFEFLKKTDRLKESIFSPYVNAALNPVLIARIKSAMKAARL